MVFQQIGNHLFRVPSYDLLPAGRAEWPSKTAVYNPQKVIDLCKCANGGTGALNRVFLLKGYGRSQVMDGLHLWPFKFVEIKPCVGGKGFNKPPLSLCIKGIKGKGGLA